MTMAPSEEPETFEGGCDCAKSRYRITGQPMYVHCCHCRWCQREAGGAFALNAMWESDRVELITYITLETNDLPTQSGKPQRINRCPTCKVVLWTLYGDNGDYIRFVKVGTLDDPDRLPPDVHIFTMSKQPWINLDGGAPQFQEFYQRSKVWPKDRLDRMAKVSEKRRNDKEAPVNELAEKTERVKL